MRSPKPVGLQPYIWSSSSGTIALLPSVSYFSEIDYPCFDINDSRQVLCYGYDNGTPRPYLWADGQITTLQGLRYAGVLNDLGEVVGYLSTADRWALRRPDGTLVPLPLNSELNPPTLNNLSQVALKLNGQLHLWSPTSMVPI